MKLQDKETLSVADTVKDVLEGKKVVKEMDPKKHVSKKDDKYVVVNVKGDVVKSFDDEEEANKYATDNHDDLMKEAASKKEGNAFGKAVMAAKKKGDKEFMFAGKKYKVEDYDKDEKDDEEEVDEMSDKQKKYQAFFNSALKKFGVKSPAELEGDKKKEFYDYVDANYEAENEED